MAEREIDAEEDIEIIVCIRRGSLEKMQDHQEEAKEREGVGEET